MCIPRCVCSDVHPRYTSHNALTAEVSPGGKHFHFPNFPRKKGEQWPPKRLQNNRHLHKAFCELVLLGTTPSQWNRLQFKPARGASNSQSDHVVRFTIAKIADAAPQRFSGTTPGLCFDGVWIILNQPEHGTTKEPCARRQRQPSPWPTKCEVFFSVTRIVVLGFAPERFA